MASLVKSGRSLRQTAPVNYRVDVDIDVDINVDTDDSEGDTGGDDHDDAEDEKPPQLFKFPPEIRNMVYKEALVDAKGVYLKQDTFVFFDDVLQRSTLGPGSPRLRANLATNLLLTCKQIYYEAREVIYGQPFTFADPHAVHLFLLNLQPGTVNCLRDIKINRMRLHCVQVNPLLTGLRDAMSLLHLRLGGRVTGFQVARPAAFIGKDIADRFLKASFSFVRPFVAAHGIDKLMEVVEFDEHDMRGGDTLAGKPPLSEARKREILRYIKARLQKLLRQGESERRR